MTSNKIGQELGQKAKVKGAVDTHKSDTACLVCVKKLYKRLTKNCALRDLNLCGQIFAKATL